MLKCIFNQTGNAAVVRYVLTKSDIEDILHRNYDAKGAPEFTVIKDIYKFNSMMRELDVFPSLDAFINCSNPSLKVIYDRVSGDDISVELNIMQRPEIENLINKEEYPEGASVSIGVIKLSVANIKRNIRKNVIGLINMTTTENPKVYIGAIGFPDDEQIQEFVDFYGYSIDSVKPTSEILFKLKAWDHVINEAFDIWCGVQHILKNPIVVQHIHEQFKNTNKHSKQSDGNDPKLCGIRYISVESGLWRMKTDERINRTGSWFVHGHWRNCSSGKKIWIDGYWKGPDRDTPNMESREVKIVGGA